MDRFRHGHMESDFSFTQGDSRLKEDLADAMKESPSPSQRDSGKYFYINSNSHRDAMLSMYKYFFLFMILPISFLTHYGSEMIVKTMSFGILKVTYL